MSNGKRKEPKIDIHAMEQAFAVMAKQMVPGIASWHRAMVGEGFSEEQAFQSSMKFQHHLLTMKPSDDDAEEGI